MNATAEKVHDMDALARWILERRLGAIKARSALRATEKQLLLLSQKRKYEEELEKLRKEKTGNPILDKLIDMGIRKLEEAIENLVAETEQADTRSWILLPAEIHVARVPVDAGEHEVWVDAGTGGRVHFTGINVGAGERVFRSCRIFGRSHPVECGADSADGQIQRRAPRRGGAT